MEVLTLKGYILVSFRDCKPPNILTWLTGPITTQPPWHHTLPRRS